MVMTVPSPIEEDLDPRVNNEKFRTRPMEKLIEVPINDADPFRKLMIGSELEGDLKDKHDQFPEKEL